MSEILQANIFFFIASVGIVVLTILVCVILYQVLKIVIKVRLIVERLEAGSEMIAEDVSQLRTFVMEGSLVSQIIRFFVPKSKSRTKKSTRTNEED
jgi:hypothetical protein